MAAIKKGKEWGYIDKDGKFIINPQFLNAKDFNSGLAAVLKGKEWGYVDKDGKWVVNPQYEKVKGTLSLSWYSFSDSFIPC